jgi:antitoxin PrlF
MYVKSRVTSKHQITLPKSIRKKLGIERGDEIVFEGEGDVVTLRVEKRTDPVKVLEGLLEGVDPGELRTKAAGKLLEKKLGLR